MTTKAEDCELMGRKSKDVIKKKKKKKNKIK